MTHHRLSSLLPLSTLALVSLAGCNGHPIKPVEIDIGSEVVTGLPLDVNKKVDVLLVLDNSGSMGEEQANLAANFGPFIEQLELAGADYRIGITTTDLGGKDCSNGSGGELHLSSCLDRPESFVFGNTDQFAVACEAQCQLGGAALEIQPSEIRVGGEAAARPWIQSYSGVSNLPAGVDTLSAFQCFAPQGISGCGWESPLEAMSRALENMQDPDRPEYGFLREDALLAVLVVTDEADCSFNPAHADDLFTSGVFFAEGMNYATSAVCWNAGVACDGPSPYSACRDVDLDGDAAPTEDPDQAVLHPVAGYVAQLQALAEQKLAGREVLVSVIAGVPLDYHLGGVEVSYADSDDPELQKLFGIGAGCSNVVNDTVQTAIPPVRLKSFAEAFAQDDAINLYSVCDEDYTPAIEDIVAGIEKELPPACLGGCALDLDDSTEELDYSCTVTQKSGGESERLPECEAGVDGYALPADADACWIAKTGADLDPSCDVAGLNLEFDLLRRPGVPVPGDVEVSAACELSPFPSVDCPG